jgi:hypothetical protein
MKKSITFNDFLTPEASAAAKLVDFYEGRQLQYVKEALDGKCGYGRRENWQERGYVPRVRNIVKSIVDKSGLLFNKPPKLSIIPVGETRTVTDMTFDRIMHECDYLEFFQNVDVYTRLLKSTIVLQQKYIPQERSTVNGQYQFDPTKGDALMLIPLHRGNSVAKMDITGRHIVELAYLIDDDDAEEDREEGEFTYRIITPTEIADFHVEDEKETMISGSLVANADGFVPANFFYDINKPRIKSWVDCPEDIMSFQELYNLHLTETEFAVAHQKQKTLFVDSPIIDTDKSSNTNQMAGLVAPQGHTPGGTMYAPAASKKTLGGLGRIVTLQSGDNGKDPYAKFDGPTTDLAALDDMIRALIKDLAYDWGVKINVDKEARASSGFQIVAESIDNLNLREQRAQSFRAGLRRFYNLTQKLYPELTEGTLWADFAQPSIPINTLEQEQMFQMRIDGNRATLVDYFTQTQEMTEQEAQDKIEEIITEKKKLAAELPQVAPAVNTPTPTQTAARGPTSPTGTTG